MGDRTGIEWADSTLNLMMGCDGCELWAPEKGVRICYAGVSTDRITRGGTNGLRGWPPSFARPTIFPDRITVLRKWADLAGTNRPNKPWLDGLPRVISWNDMGDTWTASLPLDWLAPYLTVIASSPHRHLFLTKRPDRAADFARAHPLPENMWVGCSITSDQDARLRALMRVATRQRFVSYEPIVAGGAHTIRRFPAIGWWIIGGASGPGAPRTNVACVRAALDACREIGAAAFVKQLGAFVVDRNDAGFTGWDDGEGWPDGTEIAEHINGYREDYQGAPVRVLLRDRKGGDLAEWPKDLRVREFPQ